MLIWGYPCTTVTFFIQGTASNCISHIPAHFKSAIPIICSKNIIIKSSWQGAALFLPLLVCISPLFGPKPSRSPTHTKLYSSIPASTRCPVQAIDQFKNHPNSLPPPYPTTWLPPIWAGQCYSMCFSFFTWLCLTSMSKNQLV